MAGWKLALEGRASIVWTEQEFKRLKPSGQSGARGKAVVKKTLELYLKPKIFPFSVRATL